MKNNGTSIKQVLCPTCNKPVEWTDRNPWRPFCSERCRIIDLGEWAAEKHKIPSETPTDFIDDETGKSD